MDGNDKIETPEHAREFLRDVAEAAIEWDRAGRPTGPAKPLSNGQKTAGQTFDTPEGTPDGQA